MKCVLVAQFLVLCVCLSAYAQSPRGARSSDIRIDVIQLDGKLNSEESQSAEEPTRGKRTIESATDIELEKDGKAVLMIYHKRYQKGEKPLGNITVESGSKLTLNPEALADQSSKRPCVITLKSGRLSASKDPKCRVNFRLKTPAAVMAVKGTRLMVSHDDPSTAKEVAAGESLVAVTEGVVGVRSEKTEQPAREIKVFQGKMAVTAGDKVDNPQPISDGVKKLTENDKYQPQYDQWLLDDAETPDQFLKRWNTGDIQGKIYVKEKNGHSIELTIAQGKWECRDYKIQTDISCYNYLTFSAESTEKCGLQVLFIPHPTVNGVRTDHYFKTVVQVDRKKDIYVVPLDKLDIRIRDEEKYAKAGMPRRPSFVWLGRFEYENTTKNDIKINVDDLTLWSELPRAMKRYMK